MTKPKKKRFSVEDYNDSIAACLLAMEKEGYEPVGRFEKPVFREGKQGPEVVKQTIIFEGLAKSDQ